jgi:ABC-type sugar transport system substrate-binding protein
MWNFKSVTLFVASLIVVILVSMSMANAEENKTITPQEFVSNVAEVPSKVGNWFTGEVEKTKEYQKKSWAKTKEDFASLVKKFGLLGEKNESQN